MRGPKLTVYPKGVLLETYRRRLIALRDDGFNDDFMAALEEVHRQLEKHDALAARLATCERERDAAIRGHDAAHAACVDYEARLAEAERVIRAMHKLFDRDFAIVDRDITLRCESHDQAWNYLHEARDIVKSFLRPSDSAGAVQCDGGECGLGDYCEPCPKKEVKPDAWEESFLSSGVDPADGI